MLQTVANSLDKELPENGESRLLRRRDRLVIESMHQLRNIQKLQAYDSVRGAFWEGGELYPGAHIEAKNHIQIAVRNTSCIKGYFRPRIA